LVADCVTSLCTKLRVLVSYKQWQHTQKVT